MNYRRLGLIIAAVTAVSTALLALSGLNSGRRIPEPPPSPTPTVELARQTVCGRWQSETSQKRYDFTCLDPTSFQIRELDASGQSNTGLGTITGNGEIRAELLVAKKNRKAHLKLNLSSDGNTLQGSWRGDDARESGDLSFHRVE